jgi:hypothetical protein
MPNIQHFEILALIGFNHEPVTDEGKASVC